MAQNRLGGVQARDVITTFGVEDTAFSDINSVATEQPSAWHKLVLDDITTQGASVTQEQDDPLGGDNQKREGRTTQLTSGFGFSTKIRKGQFEEFVPALMFTSSFAKHADVARIPVTAVAGQNITISVPSQSAAATAMRAKLTAGTLVYISNTGAGVADGLHLIDSDATGTTVEVATAASGPGSNLTGNMARVGKRFAAGNAMTASWNDTSKTLSLSTGSAHGLAGQLIPGQLVFIGSPGPNGSLRYGLGANRFGYANVRSVTATSIVLDNVATRLRISANYVSSVNNIIDLLFSRAAINSVRNDSDFLEKTYTFGVEYPGLSEMPGTARPANSAFEFSFGNVPSSLSCTFNPGELANCSFDFMGLDTDVNRDGTPPAGITVDARIAGTQTASALPFGDVFNTTSDFGRIRFRETDDTSLMSIFSSATFNINTNANPKNVLNVLGAAHINFGQYDVMFSGVPIFNKAKLSQFVREATNVSAAWVIQNSNGVMGFNVPTIQLSDGSRTYTRDDVVEINLTGSAHASNSYGKTLIFSTIDLPIALKESE